MSTIARWVKKYPIVLWLLWWVIAYASARLLEPRLGKFTPGTWLVFIVGSFATLSLVLDARTVDRLVFIGALVAPVGFAAALVLGPSHAGMAGMVAWAGLTSTVLVRGAKHTDPKEKHRLVKASFLSLGAMPLIALFTVLFRHR